MLKAHDQDVLLRCPRLGHEVTFGYCRQETGGKPCCLILGCWWKRFDVRTFLQVNLPVETTNQVESASPSPHSSKILSLVEMIQQAQARLASAKPEKTI
jgi:hypothetical protein